MKAIITDLDRTLLHTDKSVSAYTVETLRRCRDQGLLVLAASARPLRDLQIYRQQLGFDAVTATNGAVVETPAGLFTVAIPPQSGEAILTKLCQFPDVFLSLETSRGLYANREIPQWQPMLYTDFPTLPQGARLYKILASSGERALYEQVETVLTPDVYHTIADGKLIQIMSRQATKWSGIQRMLAHWGISPDEVVYFGDDNDDVEPLRCCGLGVAVANAIPAVLQAADTVTAANDQDGVARFIRERILCHKA